MAMTPPLPCKRDASLECEWPNCKCYPSLESVRSEALELLADALKEFKDDIRGAPVWPATRLGLIERIERALQQSPARVAEPTTSALQEHNRMFYSPEWTAPESPAKEQPGEQNAGRLYDAAGNYHQLDDSTPARATVEAEVDIGSSAEGATTSPSTVPDAAAMRRGDGGFDVLMTRDSARALRFDDQHSAKGIIEDSAFRRTVPRADQFFVEEHFDCKGSTHEEIDQDRSAHE